MKNEIRPTLTIRLNRPLQQYIRYIMNLEFATAPGELLVAKSNSYLGILVQPFISYRPFTDNPLLPGDDPDLFTFGVPLYHGFNVRNHTAWISDKNQKHIQNTVSYHFRLHFRTFADDKVRYLREERTAKGSIQSVIVQFCKDVNVNFDDISYDMISKAYYRARKKSLKCGNVSSKRMMIGHLFYII